jgi:hypothetical protein
MTKRYRVIISHTLIDKSEVPVTKEVVKKIEEDYIAGIDDDSDIQISDIVVTVIED